MDALNIFGIVSGPLTEDDSPTTSEINIPVDEERQCKGIITFCTIC